MTSTPAPRRMIDIDALLSTFDTHDDTLDIDRLDLMILLATHIAETSTTDAANDFLLSYDICPMHHCDAEICADDNDTDCAALRS